MTDQGVERSARRRLVEVVVFVAVWVTLGYLLPIDSNGYLLLGIPLTLIFQLLVRRRPIRELYAAGTSRFRLDRTGALLATGLAVLPLFLALRAAPAGDWAEVGWYLAAAVGAMCAAFAIRVGSFRGMVRSAALPIAVGSSGMAAVYLGLHVATGTPVSLPAAAAAVIQYTVLYFPASFLLEEVTFRGALDAHAHHPGQSRGLATAVLVSALWGLWHLPVSRGLPLPIQVGELVVAHILLGVPLSLAWRRSRNLSGPAFAHAFTDAVRNACMIGL